MGKHTTKLGLLLGLLAAASAWANNPESGANIDGDADGFTQAMGDCDDEDGESYPGAKELCGDQRDNDCDGFVDEKCDELLYQAEVRGGGGCSSEGSLFAVSLLGLGGLAGLVRREDLW